MVSKKEPEQKQGGTKRILAAIAIIATALFLLAAAAPAAAPESSMQPASTTQNYTPNPVMNTNITWSTFYSGWNPLEYNNSTSNLSLPTQLSSIYANPISVNASDITTNITHQKIGSLYWNDTASWGTTSAQSGSVLTFTSSTINGKPAITLGANGTAAAQVTSTAYLGIPWNDLPSTNLAYDYITITGFTSGQSINQNIRIGNQTSPLLSPFSSGALEATNETASINTTAAHPYLTSGNPFYFSAPISELKAASMQKSNGITIMIAMNAPIETTAMGYITVTGMAITTYPMTLGTSTIAGSQQVTGSNTTAKLQSLSPSFPWTSIVSNGYTAAVSQPMQNATEQQTSINDGTYTEQATYQGIFSLPTAPDLSYGTANISVPLTISGAQYEVANLNGASYLTSIQSKTNGTFTFATVNANSQNSLILEVKYTTSQWDSSSSAPSFFTLAGIEYYWWVAVLGVMGLIGLGSVAISHFGGEEETLRVPKGKYGR